MRNSLFLILISYSLSILSFEFSVMTLNAQNLFDTIDDPGKDDKAFLPIEMKQSKEHKNSCNSITVNRWRMECFFQDWDEETKNAKLNNLLEVIVSYDTNGADVIGLQEIENMAEIWKRALKSYYEQNDYISVDILLLKLQANGISIKH
jgi:hypothetical protein